MKPSQPVGWARKRIDKTNSYLIVTSDGHPTGCFLTNSDFGSIEDLLKEVDHIDLVPRHKKNAKRAFPLYMCLMQNNYRKMVEIAGSLIEQLLLKPIHVVTL